MVPTTASPVSIRESLWGSEVGKANSTHVLQRDLRILVRGTEGSLHIFYSTLLTQNFPACQSKIHLVHGAVCLWFMRVQRAGFVLFRVQFFFLPSGDEVKSEKWDSRRYCEYNFSSFFLPPVSQPSTKLSFIYGARKKKRSELFRG